MWPIRDEPPVPGPNLRSPAEGTLTPRTFANAGRGVDPRSRTPAEVARSNHVVSAILETAAHDYADPSIRLPALCLGLIGT
jgi:hypothetical protein